MTTANLTSARRMAPALPDATGLVRARMHQLIQAEIDVLAALPAELPLDPTTGKPDLRAEKRAAHSLDVIKVLLPYCMPRFGTKTAEAAPHDDEPCDASLDID